MTSRFRQTETLRKFYLSKQRLDGRSNVLWLGNRFIGGSVNGIYKKHNHDSSSPLRSAEEKDSIDSSFTEDDSNFIRSVRDDAKQFRNKNPNNLLRDIINSSNNDQNVDINTQNLYPLSKKTVDMDDSSHNTKTKDPEWLTSVINTIARSGEKLTHKKLSTEINTLTNSSSIVQGQHKSLDEVLEDCFEEPISVSEQAIKKISINGLTSGEIDQSSEEFENISQRLLDLPIFDVESLDSLVDKWLDEGHMAQDAMLLLALSYVELGRIDKLVDCLSKFKYRGIVPNVESLRHLIRVCARMPNLDINIILSFFDQLIMTNATPGPMVYTALIRMFANLSMKSEAEKIFRLAAKEGHVFELSLQTALLSAYAQIGCINDTVRVFQQIKQPDIMCVNYVLFALSKHNKIEEMAEIIDFLRFNSNPMARAPDALGKRTGIICRPTVYTYRCIISSCLRKNDRETLEIYFKKMLDDKINPDGYLAYLLICVKTQDSSDFQYWVKFVFGAPDKPSNLTMTRHVFKNLIFLSFQHEQTIAQLDWLTSYAIKRNIRLSFEEWGILMWAYRIVGNTNAVKVIWNSMLESSVTNLGSIYELFNKPIISDNFIQTMIFSLSTIDYSNWDWIESELKNLFDSNIGVSNKFFDSLVGYAKNNDVNLFTTVKVFDIILKHIENSVINLDSYSTLLKNYQNSKSNKNLLKFTNIDTTIKNISSSISAENIIDNDKANLNFMGDDSIAKVYLEKDTLKQAIYGKQQNFDPEYVLDIASNAVLGARNKFLNLVENQGDIPVDKNINSSTIYKNSEISTILNVSDTPINGTHILSVYCNAISAMPILISSLLYKAGIISESNNGIDVKYAPKDYNKTPLMDILRSGLTGNVMDTSLGIMIAIDADKWVNFLVKLSEDRNIKLNQREAAINAALILNDYNNSIPLLKAISMDDNLKGYLPRWVKLE